MMSAALLSRRHNLPIAAAEGTLYSPCGRLAPVADGTDRLEIMPAGTGFTVGDLTIRSFSISHDAADPVGYVFQSNGFRLALAADLGHAPPDVLAMLRGVDLLVLESNHCPDLLRRGRYPQWLKKRIASDIGHLSNRQASDALRQVHHAGLRYLLLAHISENNNTPRTAFDNMRATLAELGATTDLRVCRQSQVGTWIDLNEEPHHDPEIHA
jgi:phosphoribosyl 1,2-cyclic phosphodiesterase